MPQSLYMVSLRAPEGYFMTTIKTFLNECLQRGEIEITAPGILCQNFRSGDLECREERRGGGFTQGLTISFLYLDGVRLCQMPLESIYRVFYGYLIIARGQLLPSEKKTKEEG
jgi:hypothetical protein